MEIVLSGSDPKYPHANDRLTQLIRTRIYELAATKTQREIAAEIGYDKPNVLSMYKRGEAKFPLERLPALARALDVDLGLLLKLKLEQEWPGEASAIAQMISERVVTRNDRALQRLIQTYLRTDDATIRNDLLERLRCAFEEQ